MIAFGSAVAFAQAGSESESGLNAPSSDVPMIDGRQTDLLNSIVDTDYDRIIEDQIRTEGKILKPEFGFEDIFVTTGKTVVMDAGRLGQGPCPERADELPIRVSQVGVIVNVERDKGSDGCRLTAGDKAGATQILWYENKSTVKGKVDYGRLLKVYRVTSTSEDLLVLLQEIKALIGQVEGLEIRIVGSNVVVDGYVLVPRDLRRVSAVLERYQKSSPPKPIINLVEVSPLSQKLLARKMEEAIAGGKDRPKDVTVRVVNGRYFLEGLVDKEADRQTALLVCQSYLQDKYTPPGPLQSPPAPQLPNGRPVGDCVTMVRIRAGQPQEPDPIVAVRVDFVTVSRDYFKNFDFKWAPSLGGSGNMNYSSDLGKLITSFTATVNDLFPILDSASRHGYARILKTAHVLVRDGVDRSKGGEAPPEAVVNEVIKIPYTVQSAPVNGQAQPPSIQFIEVKTEVLVKAKSVSGSDKLFVDMTATQTELRTGAAGDSTIPSTQSNVLKTSLVVGNGESAALGGLVSERRRVGIERDPAGNGSSFTLFELAKKHTFQDSKEQFIVFVTPEKLRSPAEGTEQLKRKFRLRK